MQLAKVIGSMVSTRKSDRLHGLKLLVAVPIDMTPLRRRARPSSPWTRWARVRGKS